MTVTKFESLDLTQATLDSLTEMGYREPTVVQQETIPRMLSGRDLVVMSRTGTGKTAAFGIPIIEKVDLEAKMVQAVVLTPTRELTVQVSSELERLGKGRKIQIEAIYGGESIAGQIKAIRAGVQVVVGTPGRVLDHLKRRTLDLGSIGVLVLDEADKMLDMGFAQEMAEIMQFMPEQRQTLLFSATIPLGIRGLIYNYLVEPEWILLSEDFVYVQDVEHVYIIAPQMQKEQILYKLIEHDQPASTMIFCNTRAEVRVVAGFLAQQGLSVAMISSDLAQSKRKQVMDQFRSGSIRHLVATDVAARGIDIEDLSHVFIFSTPDSPELYIHRAGRTGRIGKTGTVVSLVSATDLFNFNRLVNRYRLQVHERPVPTDDEIRERKVDRILKRLNEKAAAVSEDELKEWGDVVEALAEYPERRRLLTYLLRHDFSPPVVIDESDLGDEEKQREKAEPKRPRRRRRPPRRGPGSNSQ